MVWFESSFEMLLVIFSADGWDSSAGHRLLRVVAGPLVDLCEPWFNARDASGVLVVCQLVSCCRIFLVLMFKCLI